MKQIIDGVLKFQREVYPRKKRLFEALSNVQRPRALFIGCSDSRVVPELLTQQDPGDLFVVRNVGNIVPPHGSAPSGVSASVEYAVAVLRVPDIIVCGHSGCGAMTALLCGAKQLEDLPEAGKWLEFSETARRAVEERSPAEDTSTRLKILIRENVLLQIENLMTHPTVADAVRAKTLRLHGWVFDIATGGVEIYDARAKKFMALERASLDSIV